MAVLQRLTPYVLWFVQQPGGYGTESHGHLIGNGQPHAEHRPAEPPVIPEAEPEAA
jgi:hypothetical protein